MSAWDPARTAEFFDEYGEQEWTRFERGITPAPSAGIHTQMLEGFVRPGDRILDTGSGPGRFTLELLRARVPDVEAVVGDITDLSRFEDDTFDTSVIGVLRVA